jgi:hypothetical protein
MTPLIAMVAPNATIMNVQNTRERTACATDTSERRGRSTRGA